MTRKMSVKAKVSTLAVAAALVAGPTPAVAQFVGTINSSSGIDTVNSTNSNLIITGQQAVINWTATDTPAGGLITFLPEGSGATFNGSSDFAVLNRVTPGTAGNAIFMGGNITSLIGGETIGGTVFFYSPNGIVIGRNAAINVGSLGLTTLPIDDVEGIWMSGFGTTDLEVVFGQATDPNSFIRTDPVIDGSIRSNGAGSYVALVAPQITHRGLIRTDGTAALVAAEAATIRFDPFGLFDIEVTVGTDAAQGIHVDGGTIDRNSETVSSDNIHRAYLVAVAKNDAVTMLVNNGASIGFEIGTSASVEDNVVVISGGYDIDNGDHPFVGTSGASNVPLTITNASFSSHVDAKVTGGVAIHSGDGVVSFGGDLDVIGGETTTVGGNVLIDAMNGNALTIGGDLFARAFRQNADGSETGLITRLGATGGSTIDIGGNVTLDSDSFGTAIGEFQETGTNAIGGNAQVNIGANSTLNVTGSVNVHADGYGGFAMGPGTAGNGIGGQALVMAINGGASVTVGGSVFVSSQGFGGGAGGDCQAECGVTGGAGVGTNASVHANLGSGNSIQISGDVTINASGHGGHGDVQAGGGFGGTANLGAADGSTVTIGELEGTTVIVSASTEVIADGEGGDGLDGTGGLGRGGTARIGTSANGSIDLTGPVFVTANGLGGGGANGGTGTGGLAQIVAFQGTIHAFNNAIVTANSDGGSITFGNGTGGAGLADIETTVTPVMTEASLIASGGTLTVDGLTVVAANATGGDGGFDGGDGGDAVAAGVAGTILGGAVIHAANSDDGASVIRLGNVAVTAEAQGGQGGDGQGGIDGSDAGDGGAATGGKAVVTAAAGSGDLIAGATILSASATGGDGGAGGNGDGGDGGNGGNGGSATGGFINVGTESGNVNFAQAANNGTASYTSIVALTTAFGGGGGDGGFGTISGIGGTGGDAFGGSSVLLVRGSEVVVGDVLLDASATGGDGGLSPNAADGDGGDATTGAVGVLVTSRFQHDDQRGLLTAGNIVGTAIATGGAGGLGDGQSLSLGGNLFVVINSDANIASAALTQIADGLDLSAPTTFNSPVAIVNGTVDIAGGFVFSTPGTASVYADSGTLDAAQINIVAFNFIHDDDPSRPGPAAVGTLSADNILFTTGQDLVLDAHLISTNSLNLFAPGLIDIRDATSGGDLTLQAGSTISGATQAAAGFVQALASGDITLGNVNAGSSIAVESSDGNISLGFLSAATTIDLDAFGDIGFADVTADDFDFEAGGDVNGGDIIAGTEASGDASGAITLGDINVGILQSGGASEQGFAVGIASATSISVGNVDADEAIGFATLGNLTTGSLNAGTDVMTLIGGDTTIASITTPGGGRVYHGDVQMFLDHGGPDDFVPSEVFALPPVQSGGSYNVAGAISTGTLQVGAASIATGNITAGSSVTLDAAGSVTTGGIDTGLLQITAGTDITTGDIFAFDGVDLDAGGSIVAGDIAAGSIDLFAGDDITTGDLTTQIFALFGAGDGIGALLFPGASITLESGGDISTGDISSIDGVYANADGSISTGDIDAFDFVEAHAGTSLATGDIDAGDYVLLDAGAALTAGAVSGSDINAAAGGTATIGGAWTAGDVRVASNDIDITANGSIRAGDIAMVSTNATQTVVGDGVVGGGYQLADAEYDRLHANDITIIADAGLGAAPLMLIGDLSVDGSDSEAIHDYEFITGDSETESAEGSIRILGDMLFSNMGTVQSVGFTTGTFELDAATGLLSLASAPGVLGGELFLNAAHIHVASGAILDQLADDPQYDGYQDDLNAPAAVQRPDGVIRAASIDIEFGDAGEGEINTLYVQNTGTEELPAGFVIGGQSLFGEGNDVTPPPGSIDLIINGQIVTQAGTLTGIDVRDALVEAEGDISPFTENSTINGCLLVGPCEAIEPEPPFPPGFIPTPGIQDEITLIDDGKLPPPPFGNEDFIDDNDEDSDDGETSPIVPPAPLFDTSEMSEDGGATGKEVGTPMRSNPGLSKAGDVDDPISGSGNPGLMETPPPPSNQEKQP